MNHMPCKILSNEILHKPLYIILHPWQNWGMKKTPHPNNIHYLRTSRIFTPKHCALAMKMSLGNWSRLEAGLIPYEPHRRDLARVLLCKEKDIDDPNLQKRTVKITMWVKNKSYVYREPKLKNDKVLLPPGLPKSVEVCIVKNPDHPSYPKNSLLFFDTNRNTASSKFLDRECIVRIEKKTRGDMLLAWVSRGTKPGTYILHAKGQPMEVDVNVLYAHPILASIKS